MSFTPEQFDALFRRGYETNVTTPYHRTTYPTISPLNPSLTQTGRTILIPGGGTNIGFNIARSFIQAHASTIIIAARRLEVLEEAAVKLRAEVEAVKGETRIVVRKLDVTDLKAVDKFWEEMEEEGRTVDVFVNNAVKFSEPKGLLELGFGELMEQFDVSVKSAIYMSEKFIKQTGEEQRVR